MCASVAAESSLEDVQLVADEVVCLATPAPFHAVSLYHGRFPDVGEESVAIVLAGRWPGARQAG